MAEYDTVANSTANTGHPATVHAREAGTKARDNQGNAADAKAKKGFWARYTERLKNTHCTMTPPECR